MMSQLSKTPPPRYVTLPDTLRLGRATQPLNALSPILLTISGMETSTRELQPEKTPAGSCDIRGLIFAYVMAEHSANAFSPRTVTVFGISILVRALHW